MQRSASCVVLHLAEEAPFADALDRRHFWSLPIESAHDVVDHLDAIERIRRVAVSDRVMKQPWFPELLEYLDALRSTETKFITLAPPSDGDVNT